MNIKIFKRCWRCCRTWINIWTSYPKWALQKVKLKMKAIYWKIKTVNFGNSVKFFIFFPFKGNWFVFFSTSACTFLNAYINLSDVFVPVFQDIKSSFRTNHSTNFSCTLQICLWHHWSHYSFILTWRPLHSNGFSLHYLPEQCCL